MKKLIIVFLSLAILITTATGCIPKTTAKTNVDAKPISVEEFSSAANSANVSGKEYTAATIEETAFLIRYDFLSADDIANIFIADETNTSMNELYFIQFNTLEKASEFFEVFYNKSESGKENIEQFGTWDFHSTETQKKLHIKYRGGRARWSILMRQVENTIVFFDTAEGYAVQAEKTLDKIIKTIKYN